ncbi:TetR/AcrR family transcriptional regulator [Halobacillus salinarum]|uniref:TetR/AcrR family transcriptional regulator n=1 Tax=Halobacillus salinarum TaxID=2932257 RepID=A0ABY4EIY2_9BACI|nr:TetR/AcrR family transcriptional regulator [Halobacillus salinarum]UOQ43589.1 TetR/AcrR family transcriptional regulator [Halobacillus salinarum]
MNGFERRTERKKNNILQAAYELFSVHGVQKVSIQEIAKKAQVSQVTIYNYFGGKDELLFATVKQFAYQQIDQFRAVLEDESRDFRDKIGCLISNKKEILHMDSDFLNTMMSDQPEIQSFVNELAETTTIPLLIELIEQGKKEGAVHPDLSVKSILFYVDMYFQTMRSRSDLFQKNKQDGQLAEELTHMFFYGLLGNQNDRLIKD